MIGARVIADLLQKGHTVRALHRKGSSKSLVDYYLRNQNPTTEKIEWVEGDLLDLDSIENALNGIDTVIHTAGLISFQPADELLLEKVNVRGTANILNICLDKSDFRLFQHVSSVATLGRISGEELINEESHWDASEKPSAYAISKYGAEREVWRAMSEGLNAVIVNPSIVLGPGPGENGSAALFRKIKNGFPFFTRGISGFVDVRDVSQALIFLMEKGISGERFILNSENLEFRELFIRIAKQFGVDPPGFEVKPWMGKMIWPLDALRCSLTGKKPYITRETARSASSRFLYSAEKIKKLGYEFHSIDDCINESCPYFQLNY